ncbi:MAG: DUF3572 family protein [Alphaproteobacteria bacterium]
MFTQEQAIDLTQKLFIAVSADERQINGFLNQSGIDPSQIRQSIHSPAFLAAFLDYLMAWEPALVTACEKADINPADIISIRRTLGDFSVM